MGTQDGDVAIWWKLSTPSKVQSWTGNYNGQVKLYPDWLTVTSIPGGSERERKGERERERERKG